MSITEFLLARIAEDEAVARAAIFTYAPDRWENPARGGNYYPADIAFWDWATPERIMVECEVKREVVEECAGILDAGDDAPNLAEVTTRCLAAVYWEHPDYRQEWKVGAL